MPDALKEYRQRVLSTYPTEFSIHSDVAAALEAGVLKPRTHPSIVHLVLDMFMIQGLKSHVTVSLLAQHGLMEDSATTARRLLELSIQSVYIGGESEERERLRRAGRYLAFMWRQLPQRFKHRLPVEIRRDWTKWGRQYGSLVPKKAKSWGPTFREMFTAAGAEKLYLTDYAFLSAIAHGAADHQVFQHAVRNVRVHSHDFAPVLLVYASRYYLGIAEQWDRAFSLIPSEVFGPLKQRVLGWRHERGAT